MFLIKEVPTSGYISHLGGPEIVDIGVVYANGVAVVTVTGELDVSNSEWLYECLHDAIDSGTADITLDLEHLTFMDSTGLSVIVGAHKRMRATGGTLSILAPTPAVVRIFRVLDNGPHLIIQENADVRESNNG
jgi:anti-sigma B factor antagonist